MQQRRLPRLDDRGADTSVVVRFLRRKAIALPALAVGAMLLVAVGLQPRAQPSEPERSPRIAPAAVAESSPTPQPSPTAVPRTPSATASASRSPAATPTADPANAGLPGDAIAPASAADEVAGARATASAAAGDAVDLSNQSTQCGAIQETTIAVSVEQALAGVSLKAIRAAVYPVEYFRCILVATGGKDAIALATSIYKAERDGITHAVLVDFWIANGGREFGQVNLKTATIAAAGRTFPVLAALGGRGEVVISSGEGRAVTIVALLTNTVGATTGPITVSIDAPMVGGKPTPGKYQVFLPTP